MPQKVTTGNTIKPLRNVAALTTLIQRIQNRAFGLPGMGVLYGPTGFGKTMAAVHAALHQDAIHVSVQKLWTKKTLLSEILRELRIAPKATMAQMQQQVNEGLAIAGRPLLIDEADYAVDRGMIEMIRDMHDGSSMPVILIGMEELPGKLSKWELVDGRILQWEGAEPGDLKDVRMLAALYAPGISLDDDLLQHITNLHRGQLRRICTDIAYVLEQSRLLDVKHMSLDEWGDAPFLRGVAPGPRSL